MNGQERDDALAASRRAVSVGLWGVGLVVLVLSGALGTDAPDTQDRSTAAVAGALGVLSILVALRDDAARRALGIAFTGLVLVTTAGPFVPDFHFVWPAGSPELLGLWIVLAGVALALLAPTFLSGQVEYAQRGSSDRQACTNGGQQPRMGPEGRTLLWLVTGLLGSVVGFNLGEEFGRPLAGCVSAMVLSVVLWSVAAFMRRRRGEARASLVPPRSPRD